MRILAAPDKFRGTATAAEVADAIALAARDLGHTAETLPMADGGEGTLEVLGGATDVSVVAGPDGQPREVPWRLAAEIAVIEMAHASGLALLPEGTNDPVGATSLGTGQLIAEAFARGARRVVVTLGGSATTDGGLDAVNAITRIPSGARLIVVCDVETKFRDAARDFGLQKGASSDQIVVLTARLDELATLYNKRFGMDVRNVAGTGAAGGLAGGLVALGGTLVKGFDYVADFLELNAAISRADLVITGEGLMDLQSFQGKVVGGVAARAKTLNVRTAALVGNMAPGFISPIPSRTLVGTMGIEAAITDTLPAVRQAATQLLSELLSGPTR